MTDTGAYTDVIFGIFWLLGYQFSPRLADIGGARFWRVDPQGRLRRPGRAWLAQRMNTELIVAALGRSAAPGRLAEAGHSCRPAG